jgi:hypothetical protein
MSSPPRIRSVLVAPLVLGCALVGLAGCGDGGQREPGQAASAPGRLTDDHDEEGHRYRQVDESGAPEVDIVVRPADPDGWDLRLRLRHFDLSPPSSARRPARAGHGQAELYLDGRRLARLHKPGYRLAGGLLARGTHQLTARLYADDGTVWAVRGAPVEASADLTASRPVG